MIRKGRWINPRGGDEYKELRKIVLKRDNYRCQMPGCRKRSGLQVHHVIRHSDAVSARLNQDLCISLCRVHHEECTGHEYIYLPIFIKIIGENIEKQK